MENEKNKTELKHEELAAVSGGIKYDPELGYTIEPFEWFRNRQCKLYYQVLWNYNFVHENDQIECMKYYFNDSGVTPAGRVTCTLATLLTEFEPSQKPPEPTPVPE